MTTYKTKSRFPLKIVVEKESIFKLALLVWALFLISNLYLYVYDTATSYLRADAWYFVSNFLIPWYNGEFEFLNVYQLRNEADHVQPLHRYLLFLNARMFDLDFKIEAIIGVTFLVLVCISLIWHLYKIRGCKLQTPVDAIVFVALFSLILSYNTTIMHTWSLVALGHISLFLVVVFFINLSDHLNNNSPKSHQKYLLIFIACLILFVGDDVGLIVIPIGVVVTFIVMLMDKKWTLVKVISSLVLSLVIYLSFKTNVVVYGSKSASFVGLYSAFSFYLDKFNSIPEIVLAPFADSLIHISYLKRYYNHPMEASQAIGFFVFISHILCWFFYIKNKLHRISYLPLMMMLFSYSLVFGLLIYRVPISGINYLHSPRYVPLYQIGLWGNILGWFLIYFAIEKRDIYQKYRWVVIFCSCGILVLQMSFLRLAWSDNVYIKKYSQTELKRMRYYAGLENDNYRCSERSVQKICKLSESQRNVVLTFLRDNKLNAFSDSIYK